MSESRRLTRFLIVALLALAVGIVPQRVGAATYTCDETGLNAAITAGGSATFTCTGATTVTITSAKTIAKNLTLDGGSLLTIDGGQNYRVFAVNSGVTFAVENLTIANGHINGSNGGGIYNNGGTVTIMSSTLSGNTTDLGGSGGGVYNNAGIVRVTASTFSNNFAGSFLTGGGGLYNYQGTLVVVDSTLAGNNGGAYGGAVDVNGGTVTIVNSTLSGNAAANTGGGINNAGTLKLTDSLVVNNTNGDLTGTAPSVNSNNLTGSFTFADSSASTPGNHGGATATFALPLGSPAIDAATCAPTYTDPVTNTTVTVTTDQRGIGRPQGNGCDIGAFESQGLSVRTAAGSGQSAPATTTFARPLRVLAAALDPGVSAGNVSVVFTAPSSGASGMFVGGGTSATVTADANGNAVSPAFTANSVAGEYSVTAVAPGNAGTAADFALTNTPGAAASITAVSGDHGSAQIGQGFTAPLHVRVLDQYGNPVSGATVSFTAPTGNVPTATLSAPSAVTNSSGDASVTATAAGRPGTFTVTAIVNGVATAFTLTDTAAPTTLTVIGFSPPSGPTSGGTTVTIHGTNFDTTMGHVTTVRFGGAASTSVTVVNSATITAVTPPQSSAGTVDISVTTNGQTATIHGYTYLGSGSVQVQPGMHPLAGGGDVGGNAMVQPQRHEDAGSAEGSGNSGSGGSGVGTNVAMQPPPTPNAQPGRH